MQGAVLILMTSVGVIGANGLVLSPIASAIAQGFATSPAQVLQAAAAYGLCTAASALLLAPLGDRFGADRALRAALALLALGLAISSLAPTLWVFWAAQGLSGVATGVALPATYALAAQVAPAGAEARTMGRVLAGWTLSLVIGVTLAALLADLVGWRWVYVGLAATTACVAVAIARLGIHAPRGIATSPLSALRVSGIRSALAAMGALMLAFYLCYTYVGAHTTGALGQSTAMAGMIALAYGTGFGVSTLADPMLDRLGPRRVTAPLFGATVALYLAMAWASPDFVLLLLVAFVWGGTQHAGLTLAVGRLTALDPRQRGAILGLSSTITYLAVFGGASFGGAIFTHSGFPALPLISAVLLAGLCFEAARL